MFLYRCVYVPLGVIIQKSFHKCIIPKLYTKDWTEEFYKALSTRDYFKYQEDEEY